MSQVACGADATLAGGWKLPVWTAIGLLAATSLGSLFCLGARIDALGARMDARFDSLEGRIDPRFAHNESRFDALEGRIDSRFAEWISGSTRSRLASTPISTGTRADG